jgi:phosphoribosylformylglycinamidine synthase
MRSGAEADLAALCSAARVPALTLGQTGGSALAVTGLFTVPLDELREVHRGALPALFG